MSDRIGFQTPGLRPKSSKVVRDIHEDELATVLHNQESIGWHVISVLRSEVDRSLFAVFSRSHRSS